MSYPDSGNKSERPGPEVGGLGPEIMGATTLVGDNV
jgi:hypothetical protein